MGKRSLEGSLLIGLIQCHAMTNLAGRCYYPSMRTENKAYWRYFPSTRGDGLIITLNQK